MLELTTRAVCAGFRQSLRTCVKVVVCGCGGNVGHLLALFLKQSTYISELSLYDLNKIPDKVTSIKHIDTNCNVNFFEGNNELQPALKDADIVIIAAGVPRSTGLSRVDLFKSNANVVYNLALACANECPEALVAILTNPINSTVPIFSEVLRKNNCYEPNRVFGVATPHTIRASTLMAQYMQRDPRSIIVPVVGGNDSFTLVPVFTQTKPSPCYNISLDSEMVLKPLTCYIRNAGMAVVHAKEHKGTSNLCTAYATSRFANSLAKGLHGHPSIIECAYVRSTIIPGCRYLITPVELGPCGISHNYGLPKLNEYEAKLLEEAIPKVKKDIKTGEDFISLKFN